MKKLTLLMILGWFAAFNSATAGEVGAVTTFTPNTTAQAAQVNANFQALITAINDNNARISALEGAGGVSNSVAGRTYRFLDMSQLLSVADSTGVDAGSGITFNNELTLVGTTVSEFTIVFNGPTVSSCFITQVGNEGYVIDEFANDTPDQNPGDAFPEDGRVFEYTSDIEDESDPLDPPETVPCQQDGNVITIEPGADEQKFIVTDDGSMMIGRGSEFTTEVQGDFTHKDADVFIFVGVREPQI